MCPFFMDQKYRFKSTHSGVICLFDAWDVPEMVKNYHDWECLDDVSDVLLGEAADKIVRNTPEPDKEKMIGTLHLKKDK